MPRIDLTPYDSPLEHLQDHAEFVKARARALELARQLDDPSNRPYSLRETDDDTLRTRLAKARRAETRWFNRLDKRLAATRKAGIELPVEALSVRLGLLGLEREVLIQATLLALDLTMEAEFGRCFDGMGDSLTVMGIMQFHSLDFAAQLEARKRFRADAPLRALDLVTLGMGGRVSSPEDLLRATISITSQGLMHVLGDDALSDELLELSSIEAPLASFDRVVLPDEDRRRILSVVDGHGGWAAARATWGLDRTITYGRGSFLLFSGAPGTGKTLTAHAIADRMGKRVLTVDIPTLVEHMDNMRLLPGLFREARLRDAVLFFDECETLFESRKRGNSLMTLLLTELERFDGVAVMATNLPNHLDEALFRRILVHVRFEAPDAAAREAIWRAHLPDEAPLADDIDLPALARRFGLTGGQVKNAMLAGCGRAFARDGAAGPIRHADLERAARDQLRPIHGEDAAGSAAWSEVLLRDVHLPGDLKADLEDLLGASRQARLIREEWGVGRRGGLPLVALMHGPPGTGKTLCAEAIAGELGRPLLRAVLGGLRSKWVGESERNLAQLFARARREEAVLLLDEADTVLSARGDGRAAHHDDVLTSTLLTLLDAHPGVVVLTTNRPAALDGALARRVGWHLAFPLPNTAARAAIWKASLPDTAPLHPGVDLDALARRHALSGGDIRVIAVRAAARAAARGALITQSGLDELAAALAVGPTSGRAVVASTADA